MCCGDFNAHRLQLTYGDTAAPKHGGSMGDEFSQYALTNGQFISGFIGRETFDAQRLMCEITFRITSPEGVTVEYVR